MAAKVNGKTWVKKACSSCIGGGTALSINYDDRNFFGISGQNREQNIRITLVIPLLKTVGTYNLTTEGNNYAELNDSSKKLLYETSDINKGKITITKIDLSNKIISGTFEFTAEDKNDPANTIRVTDGRFDIKYL